MHRKSSFTCPTETKFSGNVFIVCLYRRVNNTFISSKIAVVVNFTGSSVSVGGLYNQEKHFLGNKSDHLDDFFFCLTCVPATFLQYRIEFKCQSQ